MVDNLFIGGVLGYIAGSLVLVTNIVQIVKIIKEKSAEGLSMMYLLLFEVVCLLYMTSGFLIDVQFMYIINILNFVELTIMIFLKIYYKRKQQNNIIIELNNVKTIQNDLEYYGNIICTVYDI